jgi:tripartite-type tricarboxylate transporter receptor subunit TctC
MAEFLAGYEASAWFGIGAPKNTPYEIIDKLTKEINAGLADPKLKAQLADLGGLILSGSPGDFSTLITDETKKVGQGDPSRRHQAGIERSSPRRHSITFR